MKRSTACWGATGVALFLALGPCEGEAVERWEVEARLGGAWNAPLPTTIRQEGHEDLDLTARWSTHALEQPLYYGGRIAAWSGPAGWALDLVHHKLHLDDPPPEVQSLAISHGYNLLTIQRLLARGGWRYGAGLGVVVAHPESEVRGLRFDEHRGMLGSGYYLGGPTTEAHMGGVRSLWKGLSGTLEARLTVSFASVPVAEGSLRVPNLALHATAGLSWGSADHRAR
ncbi:MAG TPA: hypothetical protein VFQ05_04460 [Candidatus Eisenbacteria bacterium]|nr:hypothetical protein [Candidatus Eisenbacteria bacterium]